MDYVSINWKKSALVVIDMQYDFVSPMGASPIDGTETILPMLIRLADRFRYYGLPIVHVIRLYKTDGSNVDNCRRRLIESGKRIASVDSDGANIISALLPSDPVLPDHKRLLSGEVLNIGKHDYVIYKPRWGAFYQTPLEDFLKKKGIDSIIVAGCNFPNCPRTSIYEASERDFRIGVVEGTISGLYERGREELANIGINIFTPEETDSLLKLSYGK